MLMRKEQKVQGKKLNELPSYYAFTFSALKCELCNSTFPVCLSAIIYLFLFAEPTILVGLPQNSTFPLNHPSFLSPTFLRLSSLFVLVSVSFCNFLSFLQLPFFCHDTIFSDPWKLSHLLILSPSFLSP